MNKHNGAKRDPVWCETRYDCGCSLTDEALAESYQRGFRAGREETTPSVVCVACGGIIGPSAPKDERRCWECRKDWFPDAILRLGDEAL